MEGLKDLLAPKTLHWFSYVANVCWFVPGTILSAIFLDIENSEPTDFRCDSNGDRELIGVKCYEQYEKQYNKFGIPLYGFVIINFLVTASVDVIYSQAVSRKLRNLKTLETRMMMWKGELSGKSFSKRTVCNFLPDLFSGFLLSFCRPNYFIRSAFPRTSIVT